jgi:Tol biopolymer transport system component
VSLFLVSCIIDLSGPGTMTGYFALAPEFPAGAATVVDVDEVRLVLRRTSDSTVALDTTVQLAVEDSVIDLNLEVVVKETNETFWLEIECFDEAGNLVFAAGPLEVMATTSGEVEAQDVEVEYVGVGSDAVAVEILDTDVIVEFGETYTLQAQSLDGQGEPIPGTPIKWISQDTHRVSVPDPAVGQIVGETLRGWAHVEAQLLTGPSDTVDVFVEPVPSQITIFSGDGQTGEPGTELPVVLEVQVNALDGPVQGLTVDFTTADGGSFTQPTMATDVDGYAWTTWTLGPSTGQQTAIATVRAYPALQATFTATSETPPATVSWTNANGGLWSEPSNWSSGTVPGPADTVEITLDGQYTVTLDSDATVEVLTVAGAAGSPTFYVTANATLTVNDVFLVGPQVTVQVLGTITGAGSISNNDSYFSLEGGTISTSGEFTTAGTLAFLGGVTHTIDGTVVSNAPGGGIDWFAGDIALTNGAIIQNLEGGYFLVTAQGSVTGSIPVHNWGVFEKDGPDSTIVEAGLENYGNVNIGAGWLVVGGELWHSDAALLSGIGTLDIVDAMIVDFTGDIGPGESPGILTVEGSVPLDAASTVFIELDGSTAGTEYDVLDVSGALQVAGNLDVVTGFTPTPGDRFTVMSFGSRTGDFSSMSGLDLGGGLTLEPQWNATSFELVATSAAAANAIRWTGAGADANWSNTDNWDLGRIPGPLDSVFIALDGNYTVNLDVDATVAWLQVGAPGNTGGQSLAVPLGTTLQVDSTGNVFESGGLWLSEGTLAGDGDVIVGGLLSCHACTMSGTGVTRTEGLGNITIGLVAGAAAVLDGRTVENGSTLQWSNNDIVMNNGAVIDNTGIMLFEADGVTISYGGIGAQPRIVNQGNGTWRRQGTTGVATTAVPVENRRLIQVNQATLEFTENTTHIGALAVIDVGRPGLSGGTAIFSSGTHTLDASSYVFVTPEGTVQFTGADATISGTYDNTGAGARTEVSGGIVLFNGTNTVEIPILDLKAGTLGGDATIAVVESMSWTGGNLAGTGTLAINPGATLNIDGAIAKTLDALTVDNRGSTVWTNGNITGLNGAQFLNGAGGTFDMQFDGTLGGGGTFQNNGVLQYTGSTVASFGWTLTNSGTLDAVGPGGILRLIGNFTHQDGAIVRGSGTLDYGAANILAWDGDVNPGTSPGILNLIGDAQPSALATANIEIGGLVAGTEHDRVTVDGNFTADGTLNASITNGFPPQVGQTFTVLTFTGTRAGDFASYTGMDLGGGLVLEPQWNATSLDLVVTQPPPAQILFAGDSAFGLSTGVFTVNADGTGLTHPYSTASLVYEEIYPRWSPDRERIAFTNRTSFTAPNPNELYMMHATGDTLVTLVSDTSTFVPRWSPNGNHIAFECGDGSAVFDVCAVTGVSAPLSSLGGIGNGGGKVYLTDFNIVDWNSGPWAFAWDPLNPDRVAVVRDSIPPLGGSGQSMIYTMLYNGTDVQRLVPSGVLNVGNGPLQINGNLDWSSDGQWLVFAAADPLGQQNIYRIARNGTSLTQLTSTLDQDVSPLWSPDGSEVLFGRNLESGGYCNYDAWIMNADGSSAHQITAEYICDWNLETLGADWSPDGQEIALTGFDQPYSNLSIYVVPRTVTEATYAAQRRLISRISTLFGEVLDIQPSWRP